MRDDDDTEDNNVDQGDAQMTQWLMLAKFQISLLQFDELKINK